MKPSDLDPEGVDRGLHSLT